MSGNGPIERKREQPLLASDLEGAQPLYFHLPTPFIPGAETTSAGNKSALKAFKDTIRSLTEQDGNSNLPSNILGQFAIGLIRGRMIVVTTNKPVGLYGLTPSGQEIEFTAPHILTSRWSVYENGTGPRFQAAVGKLLEESLPEPLATS